MPDVSLDDVLALLGPALGVAFVGYTDNILTGRAFASRHGERIDAKQELLALGAANLGSGLLHGFPVSSSGSRTAIGDAVGGRTQLASLVTVLCTVAALLFARPLLAAFPLAALGAVVVYAAIRLVDVGEFVRFARFRRSEFLLAAGTTAAVLAGRASWTECWSRSVSPYSTCSDASRGPTTRSRDTCRAWPACTTSTTTLPPSRWPGCWSTGTTPRSSSPTPRTSATAPWPRSNEPAGRCEWFVLNTEAIVEIDITAMDVLEDLRRELDGPRHGRRPGRVKQDLRDELAPTGFLERIGEDRIFPTLPTAVEAFREWQAGREGDGDDPTSPEHVGE